MSLNVTLCRDAAGWLRPIVEGGGGGRGFRPGALRGTLSVEGH